MTYRRPSTLKICSARRAIVFVAEMLSRCLSRFPVVPNTPMRARSGTIPLLSCQRLCRVERVWVSVFVGTITTHWPHARGCVLINEKRRRLCRYGEDARGRRVGLVISRKKAMGP